LIFAGFLRNAAEALAGSPDPAIRVWLREGSGSGFQAVFPEAPAREHGYAWLTVADSGLGIDSSLLSQISAGKAVSSKFGHAGLGLLISKTLARAHHGLIALESTPGQGTAAHLALPGTPAPSLNPASSLT
jgi:signal transduction histidine kinase